MASPVSRTAPSGAWENIIEPAKVGTLNLLNAALEYGHRVQRVVVTSSFSAVFDLGRPLGTVFTAKDWNETAKEYALAKGDALEPVHAYRASKVWAEEAAWDWMKKGPKFDLVTILPPLVCGPAIHPLASQQSLGTSNIELLGLLTGSGNISALEARNQPEQPIIDVRDVANTHVRALTRPEAGGQRIPVSKGIHYYQEFLDIIHNVPELVDQFPKAEWGEPGARRDYKFMPQYGFDATPSVELLSLTYLNLEDTVIDAAKSLLKKKVEYGWNFEGDS
ncbi:hypothetical protein BD779DRAFT_1527952 [Infundibulicybe gibba]|nr:hypothetical protein BD779DRAFT_1527952 [Infundibulicybe gibba]